MADLIQFRRDTAANWANANPILAQGEIGFVLPNFNQFKIGNGVTAWNSLTAKNFNEFTDQLSMQASADPSTPPANTLIIYAKKIAGRMFPHVIGASGLDWSFQPFLARNKIGYWCPQGNSTTVPGVFGFTAYTALGTATARNVATTNLFQRMRRLGFVSAATAASLCGARVAVNQVTTGDGSLGGFFKLIRFGCSDAATVAGARQFVGITASSTAPTNVEPSTLVNCIGVGNGAADTNLKLFYGGSSAQTPIDLGANFPANTLSTDVYELAIFSPTSPANTVYWEVTRLNTGHAASGILAGTAGVAFPAPTTLLTYSQNWRCNNATALAVGLDIMSDYIETDY